MSEIKNERNIVKIIEKPIISLSIIAFISLVIRLYYFPFEIPVIYDGIDYFSYAMVVSQEGQLPVNWNLSNNGWPIFLSLFFSFFNSENLLEFTYLQRFLSITISILTIIPVYLLCRRFVTKQFAIIGASLFILEPRIIFNSLIGIPEPGYILLATISLFLFLSKRYTIILISFFTLGVCSIIRYEGFLFFFPLIIIFFVRFRNDDKIIQKVILIIGVFFLTIFPIAYTMNEITGYDGIISPIIGGGMDYISIHIIEGIPDVDDPIYGSDIEGNRITTFLSLGIINTVKFLGWILIPTFLLFIPIGIISFLKNRDYKTYTIILLSMTIMIPAFYAYGRGIEETRYLYIIFPILSIISSIGIKKISEKFKKQNIILIIIFLGIVTSSIIFIEDKKIDYQYEKESYLIAKYIENNVGGINHWSQWKYIPISEIANNWPKIPVPIENSYDQPVEIKRLDIKEHKNLVDYITENKNNGLTHLVVDGKQKTEFLNDIFYNENIPYLIKQYDSKENGYEYHVKIFKIDYKLLSKNDLKN